jgi:hypothetical protein
MEKEFILKIYVSFNEILLFFLSIFNGSFNLILIFYSFQFLLRRYSISFETKLLIDRLDSEYLYKLFNHHYTPNFLKNLYYKSKSFLFNYSETLK